MTVRRSRTHGSPRAGTESAGGLVLVGARPADGGRGGYSLAETMVAFLLAMLILGSLYLIFMQSTRDYEGSGEEAQLVASARAVLEHMERDISAGHQVLIPDQGLPSKTNLVIARYTPDDPGKRVDANKDGDVVYPFYEDGMKAPPRMPAQRITYRFDDATREVSRLAESGIVEAQTDLTKPGLMTTYTFKNPLLVEMHTLAPIISSLQLTYMFYDDKGQPALAQSDQDLPRTACIGVLLSAVKDTGVYAAGVYASHNGQPAARRQPGIVIATKIWLQRRVSEVSHPEYFSSVDDDLRF